MTASLMLAACGSAVMGLFGLPLCGCSEFLSKSEDTEDAEETDSVVVESPGEPVTSLFEFVDIQQASYNGEYVYRVGTLSNGNSVVWQGEGTSRFIYVGGEVTIARGAILISQETGESAISYEEFESKYL